jgi:argininosuccinate lyase
LLKEKRAKKKPMSKNQKENANPMWGGHFKTAPDELLQKINASIGFDYRLYKQDIEGSIAHARMLLKQGIIGAEDANNIVDGLTRILREIEEGNFKFSEKLEDIHMNIESKLKALVGESAGRLHTARSRNDQVAVDFKMWVRAEIDKTIANIRALQKALVIRAEEFFDAIMPGFTHLQAAQPVTFGHHLMAYYEMLQRDASRFADCRERLNECPLGSAALAGTSFNIDRVQTAKELEFDKPTNNSLDSVSDRDFALEFLADASICQMHLSRFAEELVTFSSKQFGFIKLSDKYTTGSSIMPQKRNPDAAELVRGKTGRVYGSLISLLTTMKGLPLAYNKDSQEDKEPVFDAAETLEICLKVTTGMVADLSVDKAKMLSSAKAGFPTATDFADWLVQNLNIPFRDAHHITGKAVVLAEDKNCDLADLALADLQKIEPRITAKIFDVLSVESCVAVRKSYGGTAPNNVLEQIKQAKKELKL